MGLWALSVGTFSLLSIDGGGLRSRVLVSGSTPDLGCLVSEQGKQARKQHSSVVSASVSASGSCLEFLPWLPLTIECNL